MEIPFPFSKDAELFIWGPIPGRAMYLSTCMRPCFRKVMETYHLPPWPHAAILFQQRRMVWLNDFAELRRRGIIYFTQIMQPQERRKSLWQDYQRGLNALEDVHKQIKAYNLGTLSDDDFWNLYLDYIKAYDEFWVPTIVVEIGNYGSPMLLEKALAPIIGNEADHHRVTEALTAPEAASFYQEEEIDLAETNDLSSHHSRYFWLNNSYAQAAEVTLEEFAERKEKINPKSRQAFTEHAQSLQKKREDIAKEFHLPSSVLQLAKTIRRGIEWQDHRKKNIFISISYQDLLVREAARRLTLSYDDALNALHWELPAIAQGHLPSVPLEGRDEGFGILIDENQERLIPQQRMQEFWNIYVQKPVSKDIREFKGTVASSNATSLRAQVRILFDPHGTFEDGEVLVTSMTSPEFIHAMRKASAVITDTGGITSHAAIVSRELKIPCIVGTKIATSVLKDGDVVEIDTQHGIVKRIDH
jgi:phosphohistidine swiveling domain-containing protein